MDSHLEINYFTMERPETPIMIMEIADRIDHQGLAKEPMLSSCLQLEFLHVPYSFVRDPATFCFLHRDKCSAMPRVSYLSMTFQISDVHKSSMET